MLELQNSRSCLLPHCPRLLISEKHCLWQQGTSLSLFHFIALVSPSCPNCLHTDACCWVPTYSAFLTLSFYLLFSVYNIFILPIWFPVPLYLTISLSLLLKLHGHASMLCILTWSVFLSSSIVLLLVSQILCFLGISLVVTIVVITIFIFCLLE